MGKNFLKLLFVSVLLFCAAGCATLPEMDQEHPADTPWTLAEATERLGGKDPIEPFNRAMFSVTDALMLWLIRPVSYIYASILPKEVILRIDMVSENLAFPGRMLSCLCQWKLKYAGTELGRFLINSTVGIAGIFDPAEYYIGWKQRHENMGQAFACWGIGPGCLVILPVSTATNTRDHIGSLFDMVLDGKFILPYAQSVATLNRAVGKLDLYVEMTESSYDPYETYKMLLLANRYIQLKDLEDVLASQQIAAMKQQKKTPAEKLLPVAAKRPGRAFEGTLKEVADYYHSENEWTDTLRVTFFKTKAAKKSIWLKHSLWNTDFISQGTTRSIRFSGDLPKIYYRFWKNEHSKKLVIIIPGIGTHYTGGTLQAFAELARDEGKASVAVISSPFNWEFARGCGSLTPGYTPHDAQNVRLAVKLMLEDLKKNEKFEPSELGLAGYSLGGLEILHVAAMEKDEKTLPVNYYVALNPPFSPVHSMKVFDDAAQSSRKWNTKEFFARLDSSVPKFLYLAQAQNIHPLPKIKGQEELGEAYKIRIAGDAAAVMAGLSYRLTMREILTSAAAGGKVKNLFKNKWSWWKRFPLYWEADRFSGYDYAQKLALPAGFSYEQAVLKSSLLPVAEKLKNDPSVRILHNIDDPILSDEEVRKLDALFGKQITWFDHGGHMGNLYLKEFQDTLVKTLVSEEKMKKPVQETPPLQKKTPKTAEKAEK